MKKHLIIFSLFLLSPFLAQAALMGFEDGNIFNPEVSITEPEYLCFLNNECLKKDGTKTTREALGLSPIPQTAPVSDFPQNTPQTVYVPVYVPETTGQGAVPPTPTPTPSDTTNPIIRYFSLGNHGFNKGEFQVNEPYSSIKLFTAEWNLEKSAYEPTTTELPITVTYYKDQCGPGDIESGGCTLENRVGKDRVNYGELYYITVNADYNGWVFLEAQDNAGNKGLSQVVKLN